MFGKVREKWLRVGLEGRPTNREEAEAAIRECYAEVGLEPPRLVVWLHSPLGGVIGSLIVSRVVPQVVGQVGDQVGAQVGDQVVGQVVGQVGDQVRGQVWDQVGDQVGEQVVDQVWDQVRAQVGDQVGGQVWDQVGEQVKDQVWDQVLAQVRDQVRAQVGDQVRAQVVDQVWDQVVDQVMDQVMDQVWDQVWDQVRRSINREDVVSVLGNCGYGSHDAHWLAYYDFFKQVGLSCCDKLVPLMRLAGSCGWWWPFLDVVVCTDLPTRLELDHQGRLHCENDLAIEYPDGWGVAMWHGTRIPSEWVQQPDKLDPSTALTHPNVEHRRCAAEIIGWEKVLDQLKPTTVDKDKDPMIGELLLVDLPDAPAQQFLKVLCGTGRTFVLPCVHNDFITALEANAASWGEDGVDPKLLLSRKWRT